MKKISERIHPELIKSVEIIKSSGLEVSLQSDEELMKFRGHFQVLRNQMRAKLAPVEGVDISEISLTAKDGAAIKARIYRPSDSSEVLPVVLWIHGGGFIIGNVESDDFSASRHAAEVNCVVVSVDYRLAPEYPFPTPLEDCYSVLKWVFDHCAEWSIDPARIAVAGRSAGAGLAAGLAQMARDRGEVPIIFQQLIFPMLDDRNIAQPGGSVEDTSLWTRANNLFAWRAYLGREPGTDQTPEYASPGRTQNLDGLPPTYMMVGDLDLFLVENIDYAKRLIQAGVPTDLHVYRGAYHGFDSFAPDSSVSIRAHTDSLAALREALTAIAK